MARKRSHRPPPEAGVPTKNTQPQRPENHSPASPPSFYGMRIVAGLCIAFFAWYTGLRYLNQSNPALILENGGFADGNGLVKRNITYREVLDTHSRPAENASDRHFKHAILGYVTPWNSKGYDMAKLHSSKFTHISPVWYDLRSNGTDLLLVGRHDVDSGWISAVREKGKTLVLPRVVLEALPSDVLRKKQQRKKAIDLIVKECIELGYDGIVLESWSRWAAYGVLYDPNMRKMALDFINQLSESLHSVRSMRDVSRGLEMVFVIPAPRSESFKVYDFSSKDLQTVGEAVDWFSLMTYDYSDPQRPGPNAPLSWIRSSMRLLLDGIPNNRVEITQKMLIGINFYGNDFALSKGGGPIIGSQYVDLLEKHRPEIQWSDQFAEHYFTYSDEQNVQHAVFYPSLMSLSVRLDEAEAFGAGLSIWEIGQGLDYFFDLL